MGETYKKKQVTFHLHPQEGHSHEPAQDPEQLFVEWMVDASAVIYSDQLAQQPAFSLFWINNFLVDQLT